MGVAIERKPEGFVRIEGAGARGLRAPTKVLDLGNSGTGNPLADGVARRTAVRQRAHRRRVVAPTPDGTSRRATQAHGRTHHDLEWRPAPGRHGRRRAPHGIDYELPMASAQVKSALLLAALRASGTTTVRSPGPSRDHTERMLQSMGVRLGLSTDGAGHTVTMTGPATLRGFEVRVPADFSSAAFFLVAGCLGARDGLLIENVGINPTRTGLLAILREMGASIELRNQRSVGAEPVADLWVTQSELKGIAVPPELVPLAIDEFPILFIAAAAATGETIVSGADELRKKETDRIAVMAQGLKTVGIEVEERPDGARIVGGRLRGGTVDSRGDHRIAMSFAVASLCASEPIEILNTAEVATSFPNFLDVACAVGLQVSASGDGA